MMGHRFLEIQTVTSGETRFIRMVCGAIVGFMRLKRLFVDEEDAPLATLAERQSLASGFRSRGQGNRHSRGRERIEAIGRALERSGARSAPRRPDGQHCESVWPQL